MPAPPSEPPHHARADGDRDSVVTSANSLSSLYEEQKRRADAAEALLLKAVSAPQVVKVDTGDERPPSRGQWHTLLYKLGGALVALLVPCGAYLAYRVETLAPRVDSAETRAGAAKTRADTGRDLQKETLEFLAAWQAYQDCVTGQIASASERGTGHHIEQVPNPQVVWIEQNRPPSRPAPLWPSWSWTPLKDCGPEPHVPTTTQ